MPFGEHRDKCRRFAAVGDAHKRFRDEIAHEDGICVRELQLQVSHSNANEGLEYRVVTEIAHVRSVRVRNEPPSSRA